MLEEFFTKGDQGRATEHGLVVNSQQKGPVFSNLYSVVGRGILSVTRNKVFLALNLKILGFNNSWIQHHYFNTLGFNNLEANNPWIQQSLIQQSLGSTTLRFNNPLFQQPTLPHTMD